MSWPSNLQALLISLLNPCGQQQIVTLEDLADDPTQQELLQLIRDMDDDEQVNLVALAWVGRGTYDKSGWSEALKEARGAHNKHTAEYLLGLPLLGDYLEEGLAALEEETVDVSHRKQTKTKGGAHR